MTGLKLSGKEEKGSIHRKEDNLATAKFVANSFTVEKFAMEVR